MEYDGRLFVWHIASRWWTTSQFCWKKSVSCQKKILEQRGCACELFPFSSAMTLDSYLYDAFLLDIEMPDMDGVSLARRLRQNGYMCPLLFVSAVESRVFEAMQVQPLRFIRKSFLDADLREGLTALSDHLNRFGADTLILRDHHSAIALPTNRILYVESSGKAQVVVLQEGKQKTHLSMQELEKTLSPRGFYRIHRCYLVNLSAIFRIDRQEALLKNGERLPVSRGKSEEVKNRLEVMIFHGLDG